MNVAVRSAVNSEFQLIENAPLVIRRGAFVWTGLTNRPAWRALHGVRPRKRVEKGLQLRPSAANPDE